MPLHFDLHQSSTIAGRGQSEYARGMTLDRMLYLVISDHVSPRWSGPLVYEVELERMTRARVIEDLRHGQYGDAAVILELNPSEYICREVTDEPEFREALSREPDLT